MKILNRLTEFTEDWRFFIKRSGFLAALPGITSDISKMPYRHVHFILIGRSLLEPYPTWQPKIDLLIRPLVQSDLALIGQIDRPSEARLGARRLEHGHKGFVALSNGQLAGYTWGSTDPDTQLERVHPKLKPGDVIFTDSFTSPAFRGQGIQTALTLARFQLFLELGYTRAVSYIDVKNSPSLAVWQRKLNSQTIGSIDFMRIGPWYRVKYVYPDLPEDLIFEKQVVKNES
jgi:GNAT superfamily N-acetyltransferase